ncbi:MAG: response regulator [Chitinophagaceae bacterium]
MQPVTQIMVIEDNLPDFILLREYINLIMPGENNISYVSNLQEVIQKADENTPDLVFLDLNLPDSNGLETFLKVHELFSFVPIIILSGQTDTEIALQAIQAGAQDYILKGGVDEKMLLKTIQYSIERKRNQLKIQESNKLYEMVSKATNDPVWNWDLTTNEIRWNDKVNIFGYPEDIAKNDDWCVANIHPEDFPGVTVRLEECFIKKDVEQWSDSYRFKCLDGSFKYIHDRGYIIRDKEGRAIRMIGAMQDITEQVLLQQKLDHERGIQQKALLQATIEGQEKERSEIGKELHDNINQMLASVKLIVSMAMSKSTSQDNFLSEGLRLTDECIQEIRKLSSSLVPIKEQELELIEAIKITINKIKASSKLKFNLFLSDELAGQLNDKQQLTLFRIVQEQVTNILKHSMAENVTIVLEEADGNATMIITDDGHGFNSAAKMEGIGLKNMRSRCELLNGDFLIQSEPGNGCTVRVAIPLHTARVLENGVLQA